MTSIRARPEIPSAFYGAKLILFVGDQLVVILRDDLPDIPFPGHWDFPGGGREGSESPQDCVIRETAEEVGLTLLPRDLIWSRAYAASGGTNWMFAAHLSDHAVGDLKLGNEGQTLALMTPFEYAAHPLAIPHFAARLDDYLKERSA